MSNATAIVTARMDPLKKQRGNLIIKKAGTTPSACINEFYDRMIEKGAPLWENTENRNLSISDNDIKEALEWTYSLPTFELGGQFKDLTIKDARKMRLSDGV